MLTVHAVVPKRDKVSITSGEIFLQTTTNFVAKLSYTNHFKKFRLYIPVQAMQRSNIIRVRANDSCKNVARFPRHAEGCFSAKCPIHYQPHLYRFKALR